MTAACYGLCPRYFADPPVGRGAGVEPPRPSWMPIDVDGGLICSGGNGLGAIYLLYRERREPSNLLGNHKYAY
jgi:hypothetical protein